MTGGLTGELVRLRARLDADVPILHADLYDDVTVWSRATFDRWLPISPDLSVYRPGEPSDKVARFSVETLVGDELAGIAVLAEIDPHNRSASLGLFLRPSCRGKGLGVDIVRVLCDYGFTVLGLRRMYLDTLADNHAMQRAAERAGFRPEGTFREAARVMGRFHDVVAYSLLAGER
ncbi:MAG TPA: GNAT family protein [Pseudonocardiaceae bacterium]